MDRYEDSEALGGGRRTSLAGRGHSCEASWGGAILIGRQGGRRPSKDVELNGSARSAAVLRRHRGIGDGAHCRSVEEAACGFRSGCRAAMAAPRKVRFNGVVDQPAVRAQASGVDDRSVDEYQVGALDWPLLPSTGRW